MVWRCIGYKQVLSGLRFDGRGSRVEGRGSRVEGRGFRVQGSGFRVQGSGFRFDGRGSRMLEHIRSETLDQEVNDVVWRCLGYTQVCSPGARIEY